MLDSAGIGRINTLFIQVQQPLTVEAQFAFLIYRTETEKGLEMAKSFHLPCAIMVLAKR